MATKLSAAAIADGIVYVYGTWGTTGDGFNPGNNATATGDAANPFENVNEAIFEINQYFIDISAPAMTKTFCIRLVVNTGETNEYSDAQIELNHYGPGGASVFSDIGTRFDDSPVNRFILQGWKRSDGDVRTIGPVSSWSDGAGADKPKYTFNWIDKQTSTANGAHHCQNMQFKDLRLVVAGSGANANMFDQTSLVSSQGATGVQFYGCVISGGVRQFAPHNATGGSRVGFVSCLLFVSFNSSGMTNGTQWNGYACYLEGNNILQDLTALRNYFASSIIRCTSGSVIITTNAGEEGLSLTELNCYFLDGGLMYDGASGFDFATFQDLMDAGRNASNYDQGSFSADPQFVAPGTDYRLQDSSPCVSGGGLPSGSGSIPDRTTDGDSKNWHEYDFLNNRFSDTTTELVGVYGSRTQRSIGPFQNLNASAPAKPRVLFPVDATVGNISHVVGEAKASPQGGTIAGRVIVADDINLSQNVSIYDSTPITIALGVNDKIDFREDDTTDFTATLAAGVYNSATLAAEIKAKMEAVGAGTYTVTYDGLAGGNTRKFTIAVSGGASTVILKWATGTNALTSVRPELGFRQLDTADLASQTSDDEVEENFYDATLTWEYATDYSPGADPQVSGTWNAMGTGEPSASGTPGTDGALGDGTADIRVDLPTAIGLDGKFIAFANYSGSKVASI